ncbi:MAG: tetratricopeptide repeat protein [Usitatibacter sp.]
MAAPPAIAEAFGLLKAGDAAGALAASQRIAAAQPTNARAHLAVGIALRLLGRLGESLLALERAAKLDPLDHAAVYEAGVVHQLQGDTAQALACFQRAGLLRPGFFAAHFSAGLLQFERRDWEAAAASFRAALAIDVANVEALLNLGQALVEQGHHAAGEAAIARALALDPSHAAGRHALGWAMHRGGRIAEALTHFRAAAAANPREPGLQLAVAKALADLGRHDEAEPAFVRALATDPDHFPTLWTFGRYSVARGNFTRAATLFAEALRRAPDDEALPMFLAQVELLLGRWDAAWSAYAKRAPRRQFERSLAAAGSSYRLPVLSEVAGRDITLVAEQGLGDILFFLRHGPLLKDAGARLHFAGEPRLHSLLARANLFESFQSSADPAALASATPLLVGDLPAMLSASGTRFPPSISIPPDPERIARWRVKLEAAGPRPWIGVTWRAGTRGDVVANALDKAVPADRLFACLAPLGGTVVALQRRIEDGELPAASRTLGREVHDFSGANDDLEDALALVSILDRHIAVSNTNMHLAQAAGATADVLVPFPPEWRWRIEGDSPWFPGFRVHRQTREGDWSAALAALAR